jgi:uncharacterized membrane protein
MPKSVSYAIRLLYLAVVCYLAANVMSIAQIKGPNARSDAQFLLFLLTLVLCAIYCLLVSRVSERSKLALIVLSIVGGLSVINLLSDIGIIVRAMIEGDLVVALGFAASGLQIVALVLLFSPTGRGWLRSPVADE